MNAAIRPDSTRAARSRGGGRRGRRDAEGEGRRGPGRRAGRGGAGPAGPRGPARPNCATHTRARVTRRAAILCGRHLPAGPPADSPFSSNKDINPTLLARDWDEVRRA